jgi:hypothetical protein
LFAFLRTGAMPHRAPEGRRVTHLQSAITHTGRAVEDQ